MTVAEAIDAAERDLAAGRALRDEGQAHAEQAAGEWDCAVIDQAIREFARRGVPFSANDIRPLLPATTRRPAIGARFMAARRRGFIRPVGYTPSTDPATRAHPVRVWEGTGVVA